MRPFRAFGVLCLLIAAVCVAAYFGACAGLVEDDTGGKGEGFALLFAAIFGAGGAFLIGKRSHS